MIETKKARSLFAPSKAAPQIDLAKIKQAIEAAQKKQPLAAVPPTAVTEPATPKVPAASTTSAQAVAAVAAASVPPAPTPQNSDSQPQSK